VHFVVYTLILIEMVKKGREKAPLKKKKKLKDGIQSKTKKKKPKKYRCICSGTDEWCKEASTFFSKKKDILSGSFKITNTEDSSKSRKMAINQILRHLGADVHILENRCEVQIAKHHYSREQVKFMRDKRLTKLYSKIELSTVCKDPHISDRIGSSVDGWKWIIPPSQTSVNVLNLMKADSVIPNMKLEGEYCMNGVSLIPGGSRIHALMRGQMRQCRDVAYAIDMLESDEGAIYGYNDYDDCLDAEEGIEQASEDGCDDEEDDATFKQNVQADEALAVRWNLWKDEYHESFPKKSKQLFGIDWKLLKIIFQAKWTDLKFTGCKKKHYRDKLTEFESLLITAHFFRTGYTYVELTNTWLVTYKKISDAIKACSPKLAELGQMMYDVPLDREIIRAMIPEKYPESLEPVGALVDGKVFQCDVKSTNNKIRQHMYNHKTNGNGVMGLVWSLGCGLVVAASPLYLGRTSEKSAVFHYGSASTCITNLTD
jgi:hypothetical protein